MQKSIKLMMGVAIAACFANGDAWFATLQAAELNTSLPQSDEDIVLSQKITINLPAQPLATSLKALSAKIGLNITYNDNLVSDKQAPALSGTMRSKEALQKLLVNTGLEARLNDQTLYIQRVSKVEDKSVQLDKVEVRAKRFYEIGPLPGLGLTKEEIPGNVQSISAQEIKDSHSLSIADLMNKKLQSVTVNDYQGNPFQMDVQYRGFTAGPQIGTPQGLSVFFDGIRVNEPFGDVVNWDMMPMNALAGVDVFPGSNPVFGLGTLGGAFALKTKDGFNNAGVDANVLTGSFGRKQLQLEGGWNNGTVGLFGAGNFFMEDGWRENSPSKVNQFFGKASYRGDKLDLNLSTLLVGNDLVGNGLLPSEMYRQDRNGVYTSPDTTKNRLAQFQLSGSYFVNDNFTITAQAYRRNSKRKSLGADVYTEFGKQQVKRNLAAGEQFTCLFNSTNPYGLPDYYIVPAEDGRFTASRNDFVRNARDFGVDYALAQLPADAFNRELPEYFATYAKNVFNFTTNFQQANLFVPGAGSLVNYAAGEVTDYSNGAPSYVYQPQTTLAQLQNGLDYSIVLGMFSSQFYYYEPDANGGVGTKYVMIVMPPTNGDKCHGDIVQPEDQGLDALSVPDPGFTDYARPQFVDGAVYGTGSGAEGVVEGTPTAVLSNTQIDQITDGASIQFNWNFPKHKFMIGMSIDAPSATYYSGQMLGMLDSQRNAYLAPDEIRDQYAAASQEISNNNFDGKQITKSIYFSETWSPIETLHITGAARYNDTHGQNTIASRTYGSFVPNLAQYEAFPNYYDVCVNGVCPGTGYIVPDVSRLLNPAEKEKFSYYSLNPSFGATWQAKENLNVYGNWAQGTRTPSVIELGCAFDKTMIPNGPPVNGVQHYIEKSIIENRSCSLPTTLSGDPYLPQIKATTIDLGMRGRWTDNIEWNLGVYQTDLKDDIYMISYPGNRTFFDTIDKTRRKGLEAGLTATYDKFRMRLNYALTDATFESNFTMAADDNSSSTLDPYCNSSGQCVYDVGDTARRIKVKPGDRMPGVAMHNFNASLSYDVTPNWQVGLSAVAHSSAFLRGNENNDHQKGVTVYDLDINGQPIARPITNNPGKVAGYMFFNFQTSYKLSKEWTASMIVNNIFDKEYFSAGRLGRNPFSPSINGAIGPDGYNHNSNDWLMTNFLAPGAPRGVWFSLNWHFEPD